MTAPADAADAVDSGTGGTGGVRPAYRLTHVQGLRGIWCMVVVLAHADDRVLPGAFAALDMFFVASGLVITLLLFRERQRTGRVEFLNFYLRRGRRLLPGLGAMLTFTAIGTLLFLSPLGSQSTASRTGIFASFQVSNFDLYRQSAGYFDVGSRYVPLLHTWSLGVEEQLYLLLPASLALAVFAGRRNQWSTIGAFTVLVAASSAASFALLVVWSSGHGILPGIHNVERAAFYFPVSRGWEVGVGMLLGRWYVAGKPLARRIAAPCAVVGLLVMTAFIALPVVDADQRTGPLLAIPIAALVLVLLGCREHENTMANNLLNVRPLVWLGDRSYSWYLWHFPFIVFARAWFGDTTRVSVIAAMVSLPAALIAYEAVEQRLRYMPRDQPRKTAARRTVAIMAVSTLVPAALFVGVHASVTSTQKLPAVAEMSQQLDPFRIADEMGCSAPDAPFDPTRCTLHPDAQGPPIYMVGDSTSGMHSPALQVLAQELEAPLVLLNRSGCPFVALEVDYPGIDGRTCYRAVMDRLAWLSHQPPGVVFTSSADRFISNDLVTVHDPATGEAASDPADRQRLWREAALNTLEALVEHGHRLVMVDPLPHPGAGTSFGSDWHARDCSLLRILVARATCGRTIALRDAVSANTRPTAVTTWLADRIRFLRVNLDDALCPGSECSTNDGRHWIYEDSNHITRATSLLLVDKFRGPIRDAAGRAAG